MMKNTKWRSKILNSNIPNKEFENLNIDQDILNILFSRGINTKDKIETFLNPTLEKIREPLGFVDMEKTVKIIEKAIRKQKQIWIYGDYDVDGITSTTVLFLALKRLGAKYINYYIPLREEGYGLNKKALKKIKDSGGELVITVDCGITAFDEAEYAKEINLPLIITDHHNLFNNRLPEALAIIEPKRKCNIFPFTMLAGVGTIFMVVLCLFERAGIKRKAFELIDLVAIGTVADVVPLVEENRIFTKFGLEQLKKTKNKGLKFLINKLFSSRIEQNDDFEFTSIDIGFRIGPLFNAAGRLEDAKIVVELLLNENEIEIEETVTKLISLNNKRKSMQDEIVKKVKEKLEFENLEDTYIIIDSSSEYHHGVLGIAASKIVDNFYRPTIILEEKENGISVGSCRSIENFNILEALQSMPELFENFGGHSAAAGLSIKTEKIPELKKRINEFAKSKLKKEDLSKTITYDKVITLQKVSYDFFKKIEKLKPFGEGNQSPVFRLNNAILKNIRLIGKNKNHLMFNIIQNDFESRNAVWFNTGEEFEKLIDYETVDMIFEIKSEMFQDKINTKIFVQDIKPSLNKNNDLFLLKSLYNTSFPFKTLFYVENIPVFRMEDEIILNKGDELNLKLNKEFCAFIKENQIVGYTEPNISKLFNLLHEKYQMNFKGVVNNIIQTNSNSIYEIIVNPKYNFEAINKKNIFSEIKNFLIGDLPYNTYTRMLLSNFFKKEKNLFIKNNSLNIDNFILTIGIFFKINSGKKSQIVVKNINNFKYNSEFIAEYFDINQNVKKDYPFTILFDTLSKDIIQGRYCIVTDKKELFNTLKKIAIEEEIIELNQKINNNIIFLNDLPKEKIKNIKKSNLFLEYLPIEEKLKRKKLLDQGEKIYSDYSILEII